MFSSLRSKRSFASEDSGRAKVGARAKKEKEGAGGGADPSLPHYVYNVYEKHADFAKLEFCFEGVGHAILSLRSRVGQSIYS